MINLLQEQNRKGLYGEYVRRVLAVAGLFLFFDFAIGIILISPAAYLSLGQKTELEDNLQETENNLSKESLTPAAATIKALNEKITLLESGQKKSGDKSRVIQAIIKRKNDNIGISSFAVENKAVSVMGVSRRREDLLLFVDELKKEESFEKVDSPASNLIKGKDLDFNIKITYD